MSRKQKLILAAPLAMLGIAIMIGIGGEIVRLLWNGLLPPLFGLPEISFWQAFGLLILCRILFGGYGGRGFRPFLFRRRMDGRWERMTPEERDKLRQSIRSCWGFDPPAGGPKEPA